MSRDRPVEVVFSLSSTPRPCGDEETGLFSYSSGQVKVPGPWKRGRPKGTKKSTKSHVKSFQYGREAQKFEFINLSPDSKCVDDSSRDVIRSQARLSRERHPVSLHRLIGKHDMGSHDMDKIRFDALASMLNSNLRQIPGVDPFDRSPIKIEPYMHDLLVCFSTTIWKQLYSLERSAGYNPVTEYWFPLAFQDSAVLHSFIGCADIHTSGYTIFGDELRGLRHLQEAIYIVNQRLGAGKDAITSGMFIIVGGMAMLEAGAGRHEHWRIHMQGLKQLVECYGGVESLYSEPMILNKIYRADLYGTLDETQSPFFDGSCHLDKPPLDCAFYSSGFNIVAQIFDLDPILCRCIHQLEGLLLIWPDDRGLSSTEDNNGGQKIASEDKQSRMENFAQIRRSFYGIQYTLVSDNLLKRLDNARDSRVSEFCRLSLILYSLVTINERPEGVTFGQHIGPRFRRSLTDLAGQSYDDALILSSLPSNLPINFLLWALFLALRVVMGTDSGVTDWLLAAFMELSSPAYGGIRDWNELRACLSCFLWLPTVHDEVAESFWLEVTGVKRPEAYSRNI